VCVAGTAPSGARSRHRDRLHDVLVASIARLRTFRLTLYDQYDCLDNELCDTMRACSTLCSGVRQFGLGLSHLHVTDDTVAGLVDALAAMPALRGVRVHLNTERCGAVGWAARRVW
jgi:hypothetical protein